MLRQTAPALTGIASGGLVCNTGDSFRGSDPLPTKGLPCTLMRAPGLAMRILCSDHLNHLPLGLGHNCDPAWIKAVCHDLAPAPTPCSLPPRGVVNSRICTCHSLLVERRTSNAPGRFRFVYILEVNHCHYYFPIGLRLQDHPHSSS